LGISADAVRADRVREDKGRENKWREDYLMGFYVQDVNRIAGDSTSYN
jgi:hypothetical protein